MAFLPSVLATAQASGATTEDIANTALKSADAFKIQASGLQRLFDIAVAGGKAGQFELKDMAQYIPGLASSFAAMGYKGEEGFTKLISYLQILRARTGDASTAATQLQNVLGKYNSEETSNKFEKMGINDFAAQMERASKSGKDMVEFLLDLTMKATKGDLTKLPQLFGDQEMRMAITTMIQARDEHKQLVAQLNSAEVSGGVMRDLNRILDDTQAKIDSLSVSWDRIMTALGGDA